MSRGLLGGALAVAILAALAPGAARADRVAVHGEVQGKIARLVFDWPQPVVHSAQISQSRLTIRFTRPIEADLAPAARALHDFIGPGALYAGGRAVVFPLRGVLSFRERKVGSQLTIELAAPAVLAGPADASGEQPPAGSAASEGSAPAPTATATQVRFGEHPGFSRMVFDWPRSVGYRVKRDGRTVSVRFDETTPVAIDPAAARYASRIREPRWRQEGGGGVVDLTIDDTARFRHFRVGSKVVLDVLQDAGARATQAASAEPAPPSVPKAPPPPPPPQRVQRQAPPPMLIRPPDAAGQSVPKLAQAETPAPSVPNSPKLARAKSDPAATEAPAPPVPDMSARSDDPSVDPAVPDLSLALADLSPAAGEGTAGGQSAAGVPAVPSLSLGGTTDRPQPAASPLPPAPPPPAAEAVAKPAAPPAAPATSKAPAKAASPAPAPKPRREDIDRADAQDLPSGAPVAGAASTPAGKTEPRVEAAPPPAAPPAKPERHGPARPLALAPPPAPIAPTEPPVTATAAEAPDTASPTAATTAPSPETEMAAPPASEPAPEPVAQFSMTTDARATSVDLRFDWGLPVRAAAFRRAGFVWLVFDRPAEVPLDSLRGAGNILVEAEQLPDPVGTVLRMVVRSGFNPQVEAEGRAWRLRFAQQPSEPRTPIGLQGGVATDSGPRMVIPTGQAGSVMRIADPEVGDTLLVVPLGLAGEGIASLRQFMDLRLLPTTQGVAIEPLRDDLLVRTGSQGIWVSTRAGLFVSEAPPEGTEPVQGPRRLLAFAEWRGDEEGFRNRKQALNQAIVDAAEGQRNGSRMDLARFYFANGLYSEALGVLHVVSSSAPDMADDAGFRLLRGASHFLVGRGAEALADLTAPVLSDDPDAQRLRAALMAENGDMIRAGELFARTGGPPKDYPHRLRLHLGMLYAESMLATDSVDEAADALQALADITPDAGEAAYLAYLNAMLQYATGETAAAKAALQALTESEDPRARAKATFALVEYGLADKSMQPSEAMHRLERLQFAWRGDQLEYNVLRQLGRLYIEAGEPDKGLTLLQRAMAQFPEQPDNEAVKQEMQRQFVRMFTGDDAPPLPPLKALALFNDFRDLIPSGAASDAILQNLAERLVAVDLLDRAAALLRHLVRFRLDGVPRGRVGSRLAAIELLDKKPEAALTALESTDEIGLPAPLISERKLIKARALMALDRGNEALATLIGSQDIMADEVRAEIYQRAGDWNQVAEVLQRQVDRVDPKAESIDEPTARVLLRWAVALALDSNFDALKAARERYGQVMQTSAYRDPFQLITSRASPLADVRAVADTVAQADAFVTFIAKGGQAAADAKKAGASDAPAGAQQKL